MINFLEFYNYPMKIAVVSGGFDPLHFWSYCLYSGSKKFGEKLIVLLNSDEWLNCKGNQVFSKISERKSWIRALKYVDQVLGFDDDGGMC